MGGGGAAVRSAELAPSHAPHASRRCAAAGARPSCRCVGDGAAARSATPPSPAGRRRGLRSPPNLRGGCRRGPRLRRRGSGAGAATRRRGHRRRGRLPVETPPRRPGCQRRQGRRRGWGRGRRRRGRRLAARPTGAVAGEGGVAARARLPRIPVLMLTSTNASRGLSIDVFHIVLYHRKRIPILPYTLLKL